MQKIRRYIINSWCLFVLFFLSLISHWYIFFDLKTLNNGDWVYFPQPFLKHFDWGGMWLSHSNLGLATVMASNLPLFSIAGFFINLLGSFSWDIFTRLFFIIPVVLFTPLFSFLLFKKITKNNIAAFFGACIFSFNTFFLKLQLDNLTYAALWWVLPALFLSILKYLEAQKPKYLVFNALLVFLGIAYELRIMLLVLSFLSLFGIIYFFIGEENFKSRIRKILFIIGSFLLGILTHAFWIIPLKFGNTFNNVMTNAAPTPFASFYDILDAFTLHMYSWSGNLILESFIKQSVGWRHFLIPIVAVIGIISYKKIVQIKKEFVILFLASTVIFVFLGKQAYTPWPDAYAWLFSHLPLFNLYRESGKFFILISISLAFFFGLGLVFLYEFFRQKFSKYTAVLIVSIVLFSCSIFNLQHFFDQGIGGMAKGTIVNPDYIKLEKKLSSDVDFYRVLWMPTRARFGFFSNQHPFINATDLRQLFKDKINSNLFKPGAPNYSSLLYSTQQDYSKNLIANLAIKYIIIPASEQRIKKTSLTHSDPVIQIFEHYGYRGFFIDALDKAPYLKKINTDTPSLDIYENENFRPHIYTTSQKETIQSEVPYEKVDFIQKNPTEYRISLKNVGNNYFYLNFSESFHPDWKLRVGDFDWFSVMTDKDYFLPDGFHTKNDANLSSFKIDPEYIKKNYPEAVKQNSDGTSDIDLTLYFKPQSYFYLGLIISGLTLIGCLGYLGYDFVKRRRGNSLKLS